MPHLLPKAISLPNLITYFGFGSATLGVYLACQKQITPAFICLLACYIFDNFDGWFANLFKRDKIQKQVGIQIDSLCDVLAFGALPVVIFLNLGFVSIYSVVIFTLYLIAAASRLAFYNAIAIDESKVTHFRGLPAPVASITLGIFYVIVKFFFASNQLVSQVILLAAMALTAVLFVVDFRIKKPGLVAKIIHSLIPLVLIFLLAGR
jgi:CDP-diacylglycerol--serine O-phosphatidyltransferase